MFRLLDYFYPSALTPPVEFNGQNNVRKIIEGYLGEEGAAKFTPLDVFLKISTAQFPDSSKKEKEAELQLGTRKIIQLKVSSNPYPDALHFEEQIMGEGQVQEVSDQNTFLFTDNLGPCIAAICFYEITQDRKLLGITHIKPDSYNYSSWLRGQRKTDYCTLNTEQLIRENHFSSPKFKKLIDKFEGHPSYKGGKIKVFLAGGEGDFTSIFLWKLLLSYTEIFNCLTVVDTFFNPFQSNEEIGNQIYSRKLRFKSLAGITQDGSVVLCKSHDIDFKFRTDIFNDFVKTLSSEDEGKSNQKTLEKI